MPNLKTCFKCGRRLPSMAFYRHDQMADGRLGKCKECTKSDVARHREKKRRDPAWVARERARQVEKQTRLAPGYKEKFPEKFRARILLSNAVQRGNIKKPHACQHCKKKCNPDGHHTDYTKPLDVMWLCRRCHLAEHGRLRSQASPF